MKLSSESRRFVGLNVKRTLKRPAVEDDLEAVAGVASVLALQEFITRGHWLAFRTVLSGRWRSFPAVTVGLIRPVWSGQAIAWRRRQWKPVRKVRRELHKGVRQLSELRQLRAVLLEERHTGEAMWFGTTHFARRGESRADALQAHDLIVLEKFLGILQDSGHAGAFQLDANIAPSDELWEPFRRMLRRRRCTIHGVRGIEYLITWQGDAGRGVDVVTDFQVPHDKLNTDHEGRGIVLHLTRELERA